MHITGKVQTISNEMKEYSIHILGITKARLKVTGQTWLSKSVHQHQGENSDGETIMLSNEAQKTLEPMNARFILAISKTSLT